MARAGEGWRAASGTSARRSMSGRTRCICKVGVQPLEARMVSLIGRFETIYIVTRQEGHWGIQARSAFAPERACDVQAGLG